MPFTSISAGWIFTLMGLLDDGRPLNQGKSHFFFEGLIVGECGIFVSQVVRKNGQRELRRAAPEIAPGKPRGAFVGQIQPGVQGFAICLDDRAGGAPMYRTSFKNDASTAHPISMSWSHQPASQLFR